MLPSLLRVFTCSLRQSAQSSWHVSTVLADSRLLKRNAELGKAGAEGLKQFGRNRLMVPLRGLEPPDLLLTLQVLYQLSYNGFSSIGLNE